ncbi:hypothetical protein BH10ACT3_BH10ACT3_13560 [soil metagenome]
MDRPSHRLARSQLPDEFTPDTVRAMGMRTARLLARPGNGILDPREQLSFDRALREVVAGSADRLRRSFGREQQVDPQELDPNLRRSYQRTQRRLNAQAARARQAFPQLADDWAVDPAAGPGREPEAEVDGSADVGTSDPIDDATQGATDDTTGGGDDVSLGTFEAEITQTSDMMDILEQIAGLQQQQLEHQKSQVLSETRSLFFALAVSVAVIIAGIAPLVEASPDDRLVILEWTAVVLAIAGCAYAAVRAVQSRSD